MGSVYYIVAHGLTPLVLSTDLKHPAHSSISETIYQCFYKHMYDTDTFELLYRHLNGVSKDSTYKAVKSGLDFVNWEQTYDTTIPYGDRRHVHFITIWTFNLDDDMLLFTKRYNSGHLSLSVLRHRLVTLDDFSPCKMPSPPIFKVQEDFPSPYWEPTLQVQERNKAFTRRVFDDFNHQFRHFLRRRYNDLTFRKLAHAIVRIMTVNFKIVEATRFRPRGLQGALVDPTDLQQWEPLGAQIVKVGRVWLTASQNPADCILLIREHLVNQQQYQDCEPDMTLYLILSVRHVILCRVYGGKLEWTQPEPFLNGITTYPGHSTYSHRALDILLWATSVDPPTTPIHSLPIEIQDRILMYTSQGSVEPARMGCALGLGSSFLWKDGKMMIQTVHAHRTRSDSTPVESQIWIDDHIIGIFYRGGREGTPRTIYAPTFYHTPQFNVPPN